MSHLADLELRLHHETEKAFFVSLDGDAGDAVWLPKSQCEQGDPIPRKAGWYEFAVEEWIAKDKGLI